MYNCNGDSMIERENSNGNYIFKGLCAIFIYFFVSMFQSLPFDLMHIDTDALPAYLKIAYTLTIEVLMIVIIYYIFEKEYKKAIEDIKKNHKKYFDKYLKYYILGLVFMISANILINVLGGGLSNNETAIRDEFSLYPIYTYISSVLLAPPLEEAVFRLSFRSIFKDNFLFVTISSLIFGGLHLLTMPINSLFPLYLISYCSCGVSFTLMVKDSNNVLTSTAFHFMHNGIIMSMQVFMLIFS